MNNVDYKWVGTHPTGLVWSAYKKDLPPRQPWQTVRRIEFRWCVAYVIMSDKGLVMADGSELKTTVVHAGGKALIGRDDYLQEGLSVTQDAILFRNALDFRAIEASKAQR